MCRTGSSADSAGPGLASMGPGFVRRDVPTTRAGRRSPRCCFNGARLRSPGCAPPSAPSGPPACPCFNGARLRSPGCAGLAAGSWDGVGSASMGPGFVRRDVRPRRKGQPRPHGSFNGARLRSPGCAGGRVDGLGRLARLQWGPASFAGMCSKMVAPDPSHDAASMGPGFVRRDVHLSAPASIVTSKALQWGPASFAGMCVLGRTGSVLSFGGFNGARLRSPGCAQPGAVDVAPTGAALQWGPASFAGMCSTAAWSSPRAVSCFNGARLRSPGCAGAARRRRRG